MIPILVIGKSPVIAGGFSGGENARVFFQVYSPQGRPDTAHFDLTDKSGFSQPFGAEKVAEFWNERSKVWSAAFRLELNNAAAGDHSLRISIPIPGGTFNLAKELKLTIL